MKHSLRSFDPLSRRAFAEQVARTALGVSILPHFAQGAEPAVIDQAKLPGFGKAKRVIWLQMEGGMSHIDTLDPKLGDTKGPKDPIKTKAGYMLGGFLPKLAAEQADKLTLIRSMTSKTGVHASGQYLMRTAYEQRGTIKHPTLGAWAHHLLGASHQTLPSSVCINRNPGHGNGFFPASHSPLPVGNPEAGLQFAKFRTSEDIIDKRMALLNKVDSEFRAKFHDTNLKSYGDFYDNTLQLLKGEELKAFQISSEPEELREKYGKSDLGQGCLLARRLIENDVRFVEVASGGWDMHTDLEDRMGEKGNALDTALAALIGDLESRGLLESTLIVLCSEFGRTPEVTGDGGRNHYPKVFSTLLAGAGVKRGFTYGSSDAEGAHVADKQTTIQDFHSTIGHIMGMNPNEVVMSPSNRPFTIGDKGAVISDILA